MVTGDGSAVMASTVDDSAIELVVLLATREEEDMIAIGPALTAATTVALEEAISTGAMADEEVLE